ncbi:MAG: hypothetical protein ABIP97_03945, partial [Chthoniobacterales bacterium]
RIRLIICALSLCFSIPAFAAPQGSYWDFNNDNLLPKFGTGDLFIFSASIGTSSDGWGSGTLVGAVGATGPGDSKDFLYLIAAVDVVDLDIYHLDFSGQTGVTLSFAIRSDELFELAEYLAVSYDIGDGFTGGQILTSPDTDWGLRTVTFGGALDGKSDVTIRIESAAALDIGHHLEFDNIYAVPEPSALISVAIGGIFLLPFFRKKASARYFE